MGKKILFILLLVIASSALIFYKFTLIPKNLATDEVAFAHLALSLDGKPYVPFSSIADGHSTLYFYIILYSFKLFGVNRFGLRFPSAIFGVLNVLLFYLIMKKVFSKVSNVLPLVLSLIFLTLHWYFNFPRFALENPFLLFLELTAIYFFISNSFILAGLFSSLVFNSYQPGLIFFLLPLTFLLLAKKLRKHLVSFLIIFLIIIAPLIIYLVGNPQKDTRVQQELFLIRSDLTIDQKLNYLGQNIVKVALMFNFKGDLNGRHNYPGKPALNLFLGLLFLAGLILAIRGRKNFYNQFFLVYFILALIPTMLTLPSENPSMLRTFTAIPSSIYFIGLALDRLIQFRKNFYWFVLILIFIFISSIYEIRTYFYYQSQVFPLSFIVKGHLRDALINFRHFGYNVKQWDKALFKD